MQSWIAMIDSFELLTSLIVRIAIFLDVIQIFRLFLYEFLISSSKMMKANGWIECVSSSKNFGGQQDGVLISSSRIMKANVWIVSAPPNFIEGQQFDWFSSNVDSGGYLNLFSSLMDDPMEIVMKNIFQVPTLVVVILLLFSFSIWRLWWKFL